MDVAHEVPRHHAHAAGELRHLERAVGALAPNGHRTHDRCSIQRASSCDALGHDLGMLGAQRVDRRLIERSDADAIDRVRPCVTDRADGAASSGSPPFISMMIRVSGVSPAPRRASARRCPGRETDARRRSEVKAGVDAGQLRGGQRVAPDRDAIGGAIERAIVNDDGNAVGATAARRSRGRRRPAPGRCRSPPWCFPAPALRRRDARRRAAGSCETPARSDSRARRTRASREAGAHQLQPRRFAGRHR